VLDVGVIGGNEDGDDVAVRERGRLGRRGRGRLGAHRAFGGRFLRARGGDEREGGQGEKRGRAEETKAAEHESSKSSGRPASRRIPVRRNSLAASWRVTGSAERDVGRPMPRGAGARNVLRAFPTLAFYEREMQVPGGQTRRPHPAANGAGQRQVIQLSDFAR